MNTRFFPNIRPGRSKRSALTFLSAAYLALGLSGRGTAAPTEGEESSPTAVPPPSSVEPGLAQIPVSSERCARCHTPDPQFSHPVGVVPSFTVPSNLPLSGGRITCSTCHTETDHLSENPTVSLRATVGAPTFCAQCHSLIKPGRWDSHGSRTGRAHLIEFPGRPRATSELSARSLDPESATCLSCHDGSLAREVGAGHVGLSNSGSEYSSDHPIGVRYRPRGAWNQEPRLVERARLDPRIRLFNQTVGCGSCHSLFSRQDHLLVIGNLQSRLCLSCHAM